MLGIAVVLGLVVANEVKHAIQNMQHSRHFDDFVRLGTDWVDVLPNFEVAPKPGFSKRDVLTKARETMFDVQYTIDSARWRTVPASGEKRTRNHAIFLGDVSTFGVGDRDDETIPYYFAEGARDYRSYNRGFIGYAPNDLVARMKESEDFWAGVHEKNGAAFYLFTTDHLGRVCGAPTALKRAGAEHPYFHEGPAGQAIQDATFHRTKPLLTRLVMTVGRLDLLRMLGVRWSVTRQSWPVFGQLILQMKREYLSRFPAGHFYMVLLPERERPFPAFLKFLRDLDIDTIDLTGQGFQPAGRFMPFPDYFRPSTNRMFASQIRDATLKQGVHER
jgi:hypothetical protein